LYRGAGAAIAHTLAREEVKSPMFDIIMMYTRAIVDRENGQGLVEYALILSLVSVVCIAALTLMGTNISGVLNTVAGQI
jgi:pilus assembly protein Flp/PilA